MVMSALSPLKVAVSVVVPGASAESRGGSFCVMLTTVGSLIVHVAPLTLCPISPTRFTVRVCPTSRLASVGVMKIAFGGTTGTGVKATDTCVLALLPARSMACTWTKLPPDARVTLQLNEPDVRTADEPLQVTVATPERVSEAEPVIWSWAALTVEPFAGEVMLIDGGVSSIFRVAFALALFPALSNAVPETI